MSGFYRKEPLREGLEECWENLEVRSASICKICSSVSCPGVQNQGLGYSQGVPIDVGAGIKQ